MQNMGSSKQRYQQKVVVVVVVVFVAVVVVAFDVAAVDAVDSQIGAGGIEV